MSRSANSEDEDEQTGWEQLPYEEDDAKGQVARVAQFTTQVSLQTKKHAGLWGIVLAFLLAMAINLIMVF